ncbi:Cloroperoxidase [Collybia nuda]|uniref:Cloroperoxidase n=1 Tax=Collybia nuda TaxID=64659 RepID=A0A9P5YFL3_9AGAR|nr:Cloroperoxidase [Collybia nuda]
MSASSPYNFIPRGEGQSRSPCPGLNTLANHGYISRDGKDLTVMELVCALCNVYNLSYPLALLLSIVAIVFCGHGLKICLEDLAKHNLIEHDGSLVHDDCLPGQHIATSTPSQVRLQDLIHRTGNKQSLSLNDLARVRADRESKLQVPLDRLHSQISTAESALTWLTMKDEHGEVPLENIKEWFGEEGSLKDGCAPKSPSA